MNGNSSNSFSQRLKNFDYHTKVENEFRVKTSNGALMSITTLLIIAYLVRTEMTYNLTPTLRERAHVNATTPAGIEMEFDITFPSVSCALLSVDANDPTGQPQSLHIDRSHRVWKHRLDKSGKIIGKKSKFELGNTFKEESHLHEMVEEKNLKFGNNPSPDHDDYYPAEEYCGSCFGAGEEGECCNTCDDVKRAYQRKGKSNTATSCLCVYIYVMLHEYICIVGHMLTMIITLHYTRNLKGWHFKESMDIKQCRHLLNSKDMDGEGCNVHGIVALSSGGGNLHLAPGHELENFGREKAFQSLTDFINQAFDTFNVSHTVNKLRFGAEYPGDIHQLDGEKRMIKDAYGMYQYYIQIVPTLYKYLNGTEIQTNQYSVTEHMRHVTPGSNKGLPGVFFFYEVSPLHVEIEEYRHGWVRFFTSVAAVVGGVYSAMNMCDNYIFSKASAGGGLSR